MVVTGQQVEALLPNMHSTGKDGVIRRRRIHNPNPRTPEPALPLSLHRFRKYLWHNIGLISPFTRPLTVRDFTTHSLRINLLLENVRSDADDVKVVRQKHPSTLALGG
jgi:hypothetical protein